jgi:hypothetical protein
MNLGYFVTKSFIFLERNANHHTDHKGHANALVISSVIAKSLQSSAASYANDSLSALGNLNSSSKSV